MSFRPEPSPAPSPRTAVLLVNLGTPEAPTPQAVRRYLAEFLADPRVVEIPPLIWRPILHGIILRTRPAVSARKYASIWTPEGSPLKFWTEKQTKLLAGYLGERGHEVSVRYAMRYGTPSVSKQLDLLKAEGVTRILVLPLYPQYSGTTTASIADAVHDWCREIRHLPEFRFVNRYHDHPGYIDALAQGITALWKTDGRPDRLVLSFHGIPKRAIMAGDPYESECRETARLLRERLGIAPSELLLTFQSRLGRAEWLQPYTEPTLVELARAGVKRVDLACPGFTSDCLETLEEINQEGRDAFMKAGGSVFNYIPCLNDRHEWIAALSDIASQHLQGWPTRPANR